MNEWNINNPEGMLRAMAWTSQLISMINDMGVWGVPRSETVYQFDKKNRVVMRLVGPGDSSTETVLKAMGWIVDITPRQRAESTRQE
jgi:hypothetical protein